MTDRRKEPGSKKEPGLKAGAKPPPKFAPKLPKAGANTGAAKTGAAKAGAAKAGAAKAGPARVPGRQAAREEVALEAPGRGLKQHVKTAHKRSLASTLWLQRQLNDPYVARARADGWRSRSAYKLIEIDDRFRLLRPGHVVVDLGAAPGGWSQVAAARVGSATGKGRVVGIDILEMEPIAGVTLAQLDFTAEDAPQRVRALMDPEGSGRLADGVISDMAANTTGHRKTDHLRIVALAEMAADFAGDVLAPGGYFLVKLFQGGETSTLVTALKQSYETVRHVKPGASRADSSELYLLATGFRGASAEA
jgi:23S rRNA (uridine2552-2'-O)-methyltransferase